MAIAVHQMISAMIQIMQFGRAAAVQKIYRQLSGKLSEELLSVEVWPALKYDLPKLQKDRILLQDP